jgi:D-alanyl-lipoteichoic acid acyltransferase DltB (MBOAT superfamily)
MNDFIFSQSALFALGYFVLAMLACRVLAVGPMRSVVFALLNIAAVWLIFFGPTRTGVWTMSLYVVIIVVFWVLLYRFKPTGYLFAFGFLPPIALLVFAKTTNIFLVIGLSYMMFRCAHVEWELAKRKIEMMTLSNFVAHCFFMPTFLVGPISPYSYFESSFNEKTALSREYILNCLLRILKGVVKIIVISGIFLQLSPDGYLRDYRVHGFYELIIPALGFYVYMYANFSGLNDVSIGAAGLMGIAVKENFNQPYLSQSITEMWTRWHISLSEWMRDIVFLPLAAFLMRRAVWLTRYQATAVALMTVFLLIGWWHGVGWQFWTMGFLYGVAIVAEFYLGQWVRRQPEIGRFAPPPAIARAARTVYANVYFAVVASLMSISGNESFFDLIRRFGGVLSK